MSTPRIHDAPIEPGNARPIGKLRGQFGESAIWSESDQGVWWVDMHGHSLNFSRADGNSRLWKTPGPELPWARAVLLRKGGGLVVALADKLATFDPKTGLSTVLPVTLELPSGHLFNDAIVDPAGRIIIGTMLPGRGNDGHARFYQIGHDLSVRTIVDGLNTTNGLAFSPDGRTLYYSDSFVDVRKIWAADYEPATGRVGQARLFVDFENLPGKPDGAVVDGEGGYWSAAMASPYLHRFTPDGKLDRSYVLPLDSPTRPAFDGVGRQTVYLTTGGLKAGEPDDGLKGSLLALDTPYSGLLPYAARF